MIAVGVLAALGTRRLRQRIAVVGFDDLDLAEVVDPPLTVIDQDPESIGRIATSRSSAGWPATCRPRTWWCRCG